MADSVSSSLSRLFLVGFPLFFLFYFFCFAAVPTLAAYGGGGRMVGGRTEVRDVESNKEVQDLGRYSVEEYNRHQGPAHPLTFARVVGAQRQVVSGIKYYLRVLATEGDGGSAGQQRTYDAVVVVKAWLGSRELISFVPITH
ncbi:hypothetical protein C4D60_Mb01t31130 [Musa balbisiana]|uniref:Cystatin domain-containing protein n=1 Tax=Musa balbisiana TaxID=52838 RepID=A0A4S8JS17_MUSBA|nr:hypothetical protein C4D60_Mb01t31130 [Musa balbisiana]